MTDAEREKKIKEFTEKMIVAWNENRRADARFLCRIATGLARGRSKEAIARLEKERGIA